MELKQITWDYGEPLEVELWRARRLAEFFPFVAEDLTEEDKELILRYLDQIKLPDERKTIIRIFCSAEENADSKKPAARDPVRCSTKAPVLGAVHLLRIASRGISLEIKKTLVAR